VGAVGVQKEFMEQSLHQRKLEQRQREDAYNFKGHFNDKLTTALLNTRDTDRSKSESGHIESQQHPRRIFLLRNGDESKSSSL